MKADDKLYSCTDEGKREEGITVRDHIAIETMKGIICNPNAAAHPAQKMDKVYQTLCRNAYEIADAMIAESNK